ncbi:MAG: hypothetical protein DMG00_14530 [Acidobacteria bacterium]|nr:MAG: hypothetical protein DMG00_14530 [Acidobacteriota bacterium]
MRSSARLDATSLPMAIACLIDRAPCLPRRTCPISSRTNSAAWVGAAFLARLALPACATVRFSGIALLRC